MSKDLLQSRLLSTPMSETQTITTSHGEVEYEVVQCDSCGNDVAKGDAKDFVIGDIDKISDYHNQDKVYFSEYTRGYACSICADDESVDGPAGFPGTRRSFGKTSRHVSSAFTSLLSTLSVFIISITLGPHKIIKQQIQDHGFDEYKAGGLAIFFTVGWIIFLFILLSVGGSILVLLFA